MYFSFNLSSKSFDNVVKKYNLNFSKKFKDKWSEEEVNFIFDNYLDKVLLGAKIKKDAKDVINYLTDKGHELFIITARSDRYFENIPNETIKLIKKEKLNIHQIYFKQNKKSDIAKELKIDLMIDDSIDVYNNMKEEGIDCILFGDTIKTWKEVLKYIKEKEE